MNLTQHFAPLVLCLFSALSSHALAQTAAEGTPTAAPTAPATAPTPPPGGPISTEELGAYIDGLVKAYQLKEGIAGVTVAVVDRERTLFQRGYGIAAQNPERAVDPARTLFRIGSVSKTFTYLAAMQLVEQGKLKLEDEANKYLPPKLQLPADGFPPVLVWHLLTHTAGFEDSALGHLFYKSGEGLPTLDDYLARYRPKRVRPPAEHAVYSNYSVALLGALIAHVSGEPFEGYIEKHLLQPLGLEHTTFREPVPAADPRHLSPELEADLSKGFVRKNGGYETKGVEYIGACAPAGAASSSAADMARYLRMLLNGGALDGKAILLPATFAELGKVNYRNADAVGGIAHGFFRHRYGKYESLEHGGATLWFHSALVALPDAGFGVFVSTNTESGREFAGLLPRLIIERFLPEARPAKAPEPPKDFASTGKKFAGGYATERRTYSTLEKFFGGLQPPTDVSVSKDGHLVVTGGGVTRRYVADGPLSFRAIETADRLEFLANAGGTITGYASAYGHAVSDKVNLFSSPLTLMLGLGAVELASIGILLGLWRRLARRKEDRTAGGTIGAITILLAALGWLAFLVVLGISLGQLAAGGNEVLYTFPDPLLLVATKVGLAAAALSLLALLGVPSAFGASWSIWRKLRHVLVVLVMVAAALLLWQWNFILAPVMLGQ